MIVINRIYGNRKDPVWQLRLQDASIDFLILSQWEMQKSSCRKTTFNGLDLGISLPRSQFLTDGDILLWDDAQKQAVIVQINLQDVIVIEVQSLLDHEKASLLRISFQLGHMLGNFHWKSVLKVNRIYMPLTVSRNVMVSVLKAHNFNLPYYFVKGEVILPELSASEARLLFGSAEDAAVHVHLKNDFDICRVR